MSSPSVFGEMSDEVLLRTTDRLREEALAVNAEKDKAETQLEQHQTALDSAGGAGQQLVDRDGFPRADIDVHTYLQQSQGLSRASNDHKTLLENAAQALHRVHEGLAECKRRGLQLPPPEPTSEPTVQLKQEQQQQQQQLDPLSLPTETPPTIPSLPPQDIEQEFDGIAVVDEVHRESPAFEAGLEVGDELLVFGGIQAETRGALGVISDLVARSVGHDIRVVVRRHGRLVRLIVTPNRWVGRGLLGCHLMPLSSP